MGPRLTGLVMLLLLLATLLSAVSATIFNNENNFNFNNKNKNNINNNNVNNKNPSHDEDVVAGSGLVAWIIKAKAVVTSLFGGAFQAAPAEKERPTLKASPSWAPPPWTRMDPLPPAGPSCSQLVGECRAKSAQLKLEVDDWTAKAGQLQAVIQGLQQALAISEHQASKARAEKAALKIESAQQVNGLQDLVEALKAHQTVLEAQVKLGEINYLALDEDFDTLIHILKWTILVIVLVVVLLINYYFIGSRVIKALSAKTQDLDLTTVEHKPQRKSTRMPQPEPAPRMRPTPTPTPQPGPQTETKPKTRKRSTTAPEPKTRKRSTTTSEPKTRKRTTTPTPQTESRPSPTPTPQPAPQTESRPSPTPTPQPAPQTESRPSPTPTPQPAPQTKLRPSPTPTPQPAPQTESRPSPMPTPQPAPQTESRPSPTPTPQPEPAEESFSFEEGCTPDSFFSQHFGGATDDRQPLFISDHIWEAWMRKTIELHRQLRSEDHSAKASEARFWQSVEALTTSLKSNFGDLLAVFVSFSGKPESDGAPARITASFRQLQRTIHPDKLSGCDSRVQKLATKIAAWLNETRTLLELPPAARRRRTGR